jgi:hypothetical protein
MKQEPVFPNRFNTSLLSILTILVIVTSLYVRVRLLGTPLERDEGEYAYMAQLLLKGIPPYTYAYTMKLPGVALVYALFMSIFGQSAAGIRIGLLLVNTACICLVYLLGRRFFTRETAITAAAFYALLSLSQSVLGIFAHATHLVVLFSLAGIILLNTALKKRQTVLIFLGGVFFGTAFLMKQHAAIMILFALAFQIWPKGKCDKKIFLADCCIFLTGAVSPYGVVAIWLYNAGVFNIFWFWTVQYAGQYATGLSGTDGFFEFSPRIVAIARLNLPVWLLAIAGIFALRATKRSRDDKLFLIGFLTASFIMVSSGFYFREHYFVMMLPAVALLSAYAATSAGQIIALRRPNGFSNIIPSLLVATAFCFGCYQERDYLFRLSPIEISRRVYRANPFPEAIRIAAYIKEHTSTQDRIAILGSEPEILFYADRLSATGHIYMYGLMEGHRYAEEMQRQLISEIESAVPRYIVVVHVDASWQLRADSLNRILDWGDSYIPLRYDEVGIVEILSEKSTRYLWGEDTKGYEPTASQFVSVFRRR